MTGIAAKIQIATSDVILGKSLSSVADDSAVRGAKIDRAYRSAPSFIRLANLGQKRETIYRPFGRSSTPDWWRCAAAHVPQGKNLDSPSFASYAIVEVVSNAAEVNATNAWEASVRRP